MRVSTIRGAGGTFALIVALATTAAGQIQLKSASFAGAVGFAENATNRLGVTVGQSFAGVSSDEINAGAIGFWYTTREAITIVSSSIERIGEEIPERFELYQNYPNPFNPTTRIKYGIPESSNVRITIYNILGQLVSTVVDDKQPAGYYEVNWDARTDSGGGLPSGVYFYRVETRDYSDTRSMVFQK